jgi:integrase
MAKAKQRTWQWFQQQTEPGRYCDGGGLYLQVSASGGRSWCYRYMQNGRSHQMGLGPEDLLSLSEAREAAREQRRLLKIQGVDPLKARSKKRQDDQLEAARSVTFEDCARRYIDAHRASWRNEKHAKQWTSTLETYAFPILGSLPVSAIERDLVLRVLEPIWRDKPETASRIRGRLESVLDYAKASGLRDGENPARWKGNLKTLLPSRRKLQPTKHLAALPYRNVPAFMAELREREGIGARAIEFIVLTAVRHSEARLARWDEFDLEARVWTIPGYRMKAGKEFRVALSDAAVALLARLQRMVRNPFVFPGARDGRPLSHKPLWTLMTELRPGITAHGFRSSFRDWAAEETHFQNHVVEMALAHSISSGVEKAYRRGDLFDKRRELMEAWAHYCGSAGHA